MKYNINVMKSVWRRLRKPSQATLDAICSQKAVYSEAIDKPGFAALGFSFLSPSGGLGGVRPGVNYNGKQPQSHNMSTTSCHTVTLGMLLREADVHKKNGKRQEATKIRGWVAGLLSEQSKVVSSVWRKRGVIQFH